MLTYIYVKTVPLLHFQHKAGFPVIMAIITGYLSPASWTITSVSELMHHTEPVVPGKWLQTSLRSACCWRRCATFPIGCEWAPSRLIVNYVLYIKEITADCCQFCSRYNLGYTKNIAKFNVVKLCF